jgi:hypothetical protein
MWRLSRYVDIGGIDVLIRTTDSVTALLQHPGERGHGGPADTDQVDALNFRDSLDVRHRPRTSKKRAFQ